MNNKLGRIFGISLLLFGCASQPKEIQSTYVSPLTFRNYDCDQIAMEMDHVSHREKGVRLDFINSLLST